MTPMPHSLPLLALIAATTFAGAARAETCATGDLPAFFSDFSNSVAIQEKAVADPLIWSALPVDVTESDAPDLVTEELPLSEIEWPVARSQSGLEKQGVVYSFGPETAKGFEVQLKGGDNGLAISYFFRKSPCWTLVEVIDTSM